MKKVNLCLFLCLISIAINGQTYDTRAITSESDTVLASCHNLYTSATYGMRLESDAIGVIYSPILSEFYCTGALIMTADNSFKPYFLTAYHITDEISLDEITNYYVKFHYKSGETHFQKNYAIIGWKAYSADSDFLLLELEESVSNNPRLAWLGWDRSGNIPLNGVCFHHPLNSYMMISLSDDVRHQTVQHIDNYWKATWYSGITQSGSSGAPLIDQNSRIVGQLKGRPDVEISDYCDAVEAVFGRFDLSWTGGGTNTSRLSNWLDPNNSGVMTTNSSRRYKPELTGANSICSQSTYTLSGLAPNSRIEWSIDNTNVATILSGNNTSSVTVGRISDGKITLTANIYGDEYLYSTKKMEIDVGTPDLGMSILFETAYGQQGIWSSNDAGNTFTIDGDASSAYHTVQAELYRIDNNFNPSTLVQSWADISTTSASIDGRSPGWYLFRLRGVNDCGYSNWLEQEVEMIDLSLNGFLLGYNPSAEMLTLTMNEPVPLLASPNAASIQSSQRGTYEIQLWNSTSILKRYTCSDTSFQISIAGMPSGIYVVKVIRNGQTYSHKFVKR